jgi:hypothetical protein
MGAKNVARIGVVALMIFTYKTHAFPNTYMHLGVNTLERAD